MTAALTLIGVVGRTLVRSRQSVDAPMVFRATNAGHVVTRKAHLRQTESGGLAFVPEHKIRLPKSVRNEQLPVDQREWYHGTLSKGFSGFRRAKDDIGVHLGTRQQAMDRLTMKGGSTPHMVTAVVSVKNPFRMRDPSKWEGSQVARALIDAGVPKEKIYAMKVVDAPSVRRLLRSMGHDAIVYKNRYEVPGRERLFRRQHRAMNALEKNMWKSGYSGSPHSDFAKATPGYDRFMMTRYALLRNQEKRAKDSIVVLDPKKVFIQSFDEVWK